MTHISITGDLGSGKSTIAKNICNILSLKYLSTGSIQRELAAEMGMNTLEFNKYSNENKEIDQYIDQKLIDINEANETYVLDSRLGWHFVNKSFKIYVMAMDEVAASRVLKDSSRIGEPNAKDLQGKILELRERREIENTRFENIYGIRPSIFQDFDIIIDTSTATIEQITALVLDLYKKHCSHEPYERIWLSPIRLLPTKNLKVTSVREAIDCVLYERNFFIINGHEKVIQLISENIQLIPVKILGKNEDYIDETVSIISYLKENFSQTELKKWEKENNLQFYHSPEF